MRNYRVCLRMTQDEIKKMDIVSFCYETDRSGLLRIWIWQETRILGIDVTHLSSKIVVRKKRRTGTIEVNIRLTALERLLIKTITRAKKIKGLSMGFINWVESEYHKHAEANR